MDDIMSEQQLRVEEQARRLAGFLEAALSDGQSWWAPRDEMVRRIRQTALMWPLAAAFESTDWRFLRGVAQAAGEDAPVGPEVWLRVADLLLMNGLSRLADEAEVVGFHQQACTACVRARSLGRSACAMHAGEDAAALADLLSKPAVEPLPEVGEPPGDTQAQTPPNAEQWERAMAHFWTDRDDDLLREWLDQNGETT